MAKERKVPSKPNYIKDIDCTKDTPIVHGKVRDIVYGMGKNIKPGVPGRMDSKHMKDIFLSKLLPLEDYDHIVVLMSGGKDSVASYFVLRELGVPKEKMEFWHHDIDGGNPTRKMDWRCTNNYVKALAAAEEIPCRFSWRVNGFFGELYRIGASEPIEWMDPMTGEINTCRVSENYKKCQRIKAIADEDMKEQLKEFGYRMKFPAKSGDLRHRWCSAYLKITVAEAVIRGLSRLEIQERTKAVFSKNMVQTKVLLISGERRGESSGRAKYNEMEVHTTNAVKRLGRMVHQWRPVIDYSEVDIWEVLKRHRVNPHPAYRAGWSRCSCAACIFSTPKHWAGFKELYPEEWELLKQDEVNLGFTLDNHGDLEMFKGNAKSCVCWDDMSAIKSLLTGDFSPEEVYTRGIWKYPAGAFHGAAGGPC